jgi:hypothetical protein
MHVNGSTLTVAAVIGLAIGAFATGQVGGVVLPLLFVLAAPLMMMFIVASTAGRAGPHRDDGTGEHPPRQDDARVPSSHDPR